MFKARLFLDRTASIVHLHTTGGVRGRRTVNQPDHILLATLIAPPGEAVDSKQGEATRFCVAVDSKQGEATSFWQAVNSAVTPALPWNPAA